MDQLWINQLWIRCGSISCGSGVDQLWISCGSAVDQSAVDPLWIRCGSHAPAHLPRAWSSCAHIQQLRLHSSAQLRLSLAQGHNVYVRTQRRCCDAGWDWPGWDRSGWGGVRLSSAVWWVDSVRWRGGVWWSSEPPCGRQATSKRTLDGGEEWREIGEPDANRRIPCGRIARLGRQDGIFIGGRSLRGGWRVRRRRGGGR